MVLRASCLCQGIVFEIDGPVRDMLFCHCSMCRKAHGTAFRARGRVRTADIRWKLGEDLVRFYQSSPGEHRGFCSVCGSNIFTKFDARPQEVGLALGILDDDPGNRPTCHVFVGSKAPWYEITDSLPQHEAFPPGYAPSRTHANDTSPRWAARPSGVPAVHLRPVRLHPGTDLRLAIEELAGDLPEGSGFVVSGIGSLSQARLRMANEADQRLVLGPLEIILVSGSVSSDGAHLHMSVGDAHGQVLGGHVCIGCKVRTTVEILLAGVPGYRLSRELDSSTGFNELVVQRPSPESAA